jgi:signal transduction histidine kinase
MKRLQLTPAFRRRMLPLVVLAGLIVAGAAPIAYYAEKRGELVIGARGDAAAVARIIVESARQRPRLWRFDAAKIAERLAAEGLEHVAALAVRDARGGEVPVELRAPAATRVLWGSAPAVLDGKVVAHVWVGASPAALNAATGRLAALFSVLGLLLATVLYRLPLRTVGAAEQRIARLLGQLAISLQENDRRRIARDLHDGAGQALTAARLRLLALKKHADPAALEAISAHLDEALDEIRRSTAALLPPALAELGLPGAIERHCRSFGEAAGLSVHCEVAALPALPVPVEIACYRIVQEALSNTARHAGATSARVQLAHAGSALRLEVSDNGVGLGESPGLDSIRERARLVGGELTIVTQPGARLTIEIPIEAGA